MGMLWQQTTVIGFCGIKGDFMNEKVSVVVPIYNIENEVGICIESICNQSYTNLEIILVDDGSTDSSGAICDKYAEQDHRIQVVHQSNQGHL